MRLWLVILSLIISSQAPAESVWKGYTEEFPPFNFKKDSEIAGVSTEIIRSLFATEKISAQIVLLPWAEGFRRAQEEDHSFIFTISRKPEREKLFKWVGPILKDTFYLVALENSKIRPTSNPLDLRKYKVSGIKGDHPVEFLEHLGFKVQHIDDDVERYKLMRSGKLDLDIMTEVSQAAYEKLYQLKFKRITRLYKIDYFVAFNLKTSPLLVDRLNKNLRQFRKGKEFKEIYKRYTGSDSPQLY
ncbi:substrate-binding periplasmic protein [Bdellovibrio svalbardensis]|uniref:Transporter substrate-binding domain-containing protein n=1 Tax=Bdellovibrio svalbardensis TaxID=2972972 RepID=A0ABT6DLP0_9BACT|nr:transporter substrate-binding domain-containing protein [Bdellovibrio svalbardensis]MDG0816829.1 transporter substrate-binding domain-containing protein [Bdellovibrio svalbardensis]